MSIHTEVTQEDSQTLVGNNIFSGTSTFNGPIVSSGINSFTNLSLFGSWENCKIVDPGNTAGWSGSDVGAQLNSAYAALPANGGCIYLAPKVDGTCYSYTTPITFNTSGKYVLLQGLAPSSPTFVGGSCLNYTPSSGNALTLDYSPSTANFGQHTTNHGIIGISLTNNNCITGGGCGGTANGIVVGNVNGGAQLASISRTRVAGFGGAGLLLTGGATNNSWGYVVSESSLVFNATGASIPVAIESTKFENTRFIANNIGLNNAGSGDVYINGGSFDGMTGNSVACTAGQIHSWFVHYEATVGGSGSDLFFSIASCYLDLYGGQLASDYTTGTTAQFINLTGTASAVVRGVTTGSQGRTITNLVTNGSATATAIVDVLNATNIASECSVPAQCQVISMRGGALPSAFFGSALNTNPVSFVMNRNTTQGDFVGINFSGTDKTPLATWQMFRDATNSAFDLQANVTGFGGGLVPGLTIQGALTSGATKVIAPGQFNGALYATATNCAVNSVSPAACVAAASGAFVVPTTTTTYTVNTTAVTATSRIFLQPRTNTGDLPGSPTCVSVAGGSPYSISAQVAGTSFTFGLPSTTGQTCWNYWIID